MSELEILAPDEGQVAYAGRTIVVRPFRVGRIPAIAKHLLAVQPYLAQAFALLEKLDKEKKPEAQGRLMHEAMTLLADHGDELFPPIAFALDVEEALIRDGDLAEFIDLLATLIRTNRSFFDQRLGGALESAKALFSPKD